jgi:hypothetical protein
MFLLVVGQVPLGCEGAVAAFEFAAERFLASVDSHVGLKVTIFGERF